MSIRILSSLVNERVFFCTIVTVIVSWFFAFSFLRVVWVVVFCVGSSAVGPSCWLWFCREADGHIAVHCSECFSSSTLALLSWQKYGRRRQLSWRFVRCIECCGCDIDPSGRLQCERFCSVLGCVVVRDGDWNFYVSFTLVRHS